ncbi:MAG: DUF4491 family protein [Bacteroidales bacterium]|nr:DUF4491 family protein [Bacteroidales bacterium]
MLTTLPLLFDLSFSVDWATRNWEGLVIGVMTFVIIGIFHPIVVKVEYYTGTRYWWVFLLIGLAFGGGALFVANTFWSALMGVFGFSSLWTIGELFEQVGRVKKGWFPRNPKRTYPFDKELDTKSATPTTDKTI